VRAPPPSAPIAGQKRRRATYTRIRHRTGFGFIERNVLHLAATFKPPLPRGDARSVSPHRADRRNRPRSCSARAMVPPASICAKKSCASSRAPSAPATRSGGMWPPFVVGVAQFCQGVASLQRVGFRPADLRPARRSKIFARRSCRGDTASVVSIQCSSESGQIML